MKLKAKAPIDKDAVSPDSIKAAHMFLTELLEQRALEGLVALDWNTYHVHSFWDRHGDLKIVARVKVLS